MKKRIISAVCVSLAAVILTSSLPSAVAYATEQQDTEETEEQEAESETEYPESYYLPIESDATDGWPAGPQIEGEAAVVMDADTGAFLYSKNMDAKEYPASITKIMTTLVALEYGDLDSKVKFSEWAVNSLEDDSSRIWMEVGEKLTLRQALYAIMLESANDCANAVAEKIGGSEEGFAELMNQKAEELGCVNTHFVNAHGLHDENHYTCARDMAIIMQAAMENKTFREIIGTVEYTIPASKTVSVEHVLVNHQKMLYKEGFYYEGCLGGKTGYTDAALNTLVTVAKRKGRELICVILRTNGPEKICYETEDLLDYGFQNFRHREIAITDGELTRARLMDVEIFGKTSVMMASSLLEPMMYTADTVIVSLPKGVDVSEVERTYSSEGVFLYTWNGWQVSTVPVTFSTLDNTEDQEWELINTDLEAIAEMKAAEAETETETQEQGIGDVAKDIVITGWQEAWNWIDEHDIAAALVGLILIILLIPVLIIAYIRNRSSQRIRKQRQKEREERIRIEKDIDSRPVSEIEAELRARLAEDRQEQAAQDEEKQTIINKED